MIQLGSTFLRLNIVLYVQLTGIMLSYDTHRILFKCKQRALQLFVDVYLAPVGLNNQIIENQ